MRALTGALVVASLAMTAAACGSDDDASSGSNATGADVSTAPTPTEAEPSNSNADGSSSTPDATADAAPPDESDSLRLDPPVDVPVAVVAAVPSIPQLVGIEEGIFEDYGINVEPVAVAGGPEMGASQISGDIVFAGNIPVGQITLIEAGFDVVAVSRQVSSQFFDIVVSSSYDLSGTGDDWQSVMQALEGANVGVVANGAAAEDVARTLFDEAGVDPDAQTYIATGLPDTTLAALTNGEIDMAISFDPIFVLAESQGVGVFPFSLREGEGPESLLWPSLLVTASRDYVDENPEVIKAYNAAVLDTIDFIVDPANRERMIEILVDQLNLTPELAGPLLERNAGYYSTTGEFDTEALDRAGQWVFDLGKSSEQYSTADFTVEVD